MLIHRILAVAVVSGVVAGLAVSAAQAIWTVPLILQAETFEAGAVGSAGFERAVSTITSNVVLGVGAGLVLAALFSMKRRVGLGVGLGWGLAAFAALSLAPAIGQPPNLPGVLAADLGARQAWWLFTALCTSAAIALAVYGPRPALRLAAPLLAALPHLVGAPVAPDGRLSGPVGAELLADFAMAAVATSGLFWVALGAASGWCAARWLAPSPSPVHHHAG